MTEESLSQEFFRSLLENMVAEGQLAQAHGLDATPAQVVAASHEALMDVVRVGLPLSHMLKASDLVLHAEGPSVREESPSLSAFNWLAGTAERTLRKLSGALFDLLDRDARRLARALDLRLTGMAPGSLYLGFAIAPPNEDLILADDEPVFARVREAVRQLPRVSGEIDDESISPALNELVPDAAERDATLFALHRLAPTGKRGIHTVDMTAPGHGRGTLSQRERVVLAEALRHPMLANRKKGTFTGEVREVDLDAGRMHLRGIPGIGRLRCAIAALDGHSGKSILGEFVKVTGEYEVDRSSRPRLMLVSDIEVLPRARQMEAPLFSSSRDE